MSNTNFTLSADNRKAIVIESTFKSISFINLLKKSATALLSSYKYKIKSIKKEGYYIIIFLDNDSQLVQATEILGKLAGISYIFIGITKKLQYDTLSSSALSIANKFLMDGEKYLVKIESSKLTKPRDGDFIYNKYDLDFFLQSELSSKAKGLVSVKDESQADKILYILIGNKIAFVSLLVLKGSDRTPFNYVQEMVVCPLYDDCSMLSLVQVLDSGYMPIPIFFFSDRLQLIKQLRKFDVIIRNYPIDSITFYLFSMTVIVESASLETANIVSKERGLSKYKDRYKYKDKDKDKWNQIQHLIYEQVIIKILVDSNFESFLVSFPFVPYIHPNWFIQKNIRLFHQSEKMLLTPLLFRFPPGLLERELTKLIDPNYTRNSATSSIQNYLIDSEPKDFDKIVTEYANPNRDLIRKKKFSLDVRKNDILDVLNTI
ncbi:hypothetical protein [Candidatus Nitrosocosmicus sp. T]